ncbi:MAG TPA: ferritin-like domain-containing protein [Gemmatimonadaceae bacterium]|nr:ferritin-like domain-containing protein [Gemmatimonadaceae bacterium]
MNRGTGEAHENVARSEMVVTHAEQLYQPSTRRGFLKLLGVGGTIVLLPSVFAACSDDDDDLTGPGGIDAVTINLGSDIGIFNFTFVLEQLEGAFYTAAVAAPAFNSMNEDQKETLVDIRNAEVVHREFVRAVLGSNAIGTIRLNESALNTAISSVGNIFRTAEALEETGVSTLNGAGKYLTSAANLGVAGKIVSVEGRHVAAIRDIREGLGVSGGVAARTRFAGDDVVIPSGPFAGLDVKIEAPTALARVASTGLLATAITLVPPAAKPGTPDFPPPLPTP